MSGGFIPLIHPHGLTESYIFINAKHNGWIENIGRPIADSIARKLSQSFFGIDGKIGHAANAYSSISSLGDHSFLPLGITGGAVHMSQLQQFRQEFMRRASLITPYQYSLITS